MLREQAGRKIREKEMVRRSVATGDQRRRATKVIDAP
jgi:hypothetical protein